MKQQCNWDWLATCNYYRWSLPATAQKMNLCKKLRTSIKEGPIPLRNRSHPMEHKENRLHFSTSAMFVRTRHSPLEDLSDLVLPQWHLLGTNCVSLSSWIEVISVCYTHLWICSVWAYHSLSPKSQCCNVVFLCFEKKTTKLCVCVNFEPFFQDF